VKSNAEHWFSNSKVSTVFTVIQKTKNKKPTKFVTINLKLSEMFDEDNIGNQLSQIEDLYSEIDNCNDKLNQSWKQDLIFEGLFHKIDGSISVSIVKREKLIESLKTQDNWSLYFISSYLFKRFESNLVRLYPKVFNAFRGERTGWNKMFVIPEKDIAETGIEPEFLIPYVKGPKDLETLEFPGGYRFKLFVCSLPFEELKKKYKGAYNWIMRFKNTTNKNGSKTIQQACMNNKPYWYSLHPKQAHIVTAINPYERLFFSFSNKAFSIDQRLVALNVNDNYDIELVAALLNSIITLLVMEMKGTSRNLGALDLNANYFKDIKMLNPDLLLNNQVVEIKTAFEPLKKRPIKIIFEEVKMKDRISFDQTVLRCFGIDARILSSLYQLFVANILDRVNMKER
jgi:hypothetical protein